MIEGCLGVMFDPWDGWTSCRWVIRVGSTDGGSERHKFLLSDAMTCVISPFGSCTAKGSVVGLTGSSMIVARVYVL